MDERRTAAKGVTLGAIALAIVAGVVVGRSDPAPSVAGLPRAMGEPDCAPGEGYGRHEIDYFYGSGYPTPRQALEKALATGHGHLNLDDFSSRAVRIGEEAAREFTLERPDGSFWTLAVAIRSDGGWLVSTVYECFS